MQLRHIKEYYSLRGFEDCSARFLNPRPRLPAPGRSEKPVPSARRARAAGPASRCSVMLRDSGWGGPAGGRGRDEPKNHPTAPVSAAQHRHRPLSAGSLI